MPAGYGPTHGLAGVLPWSWAEERLVAARSYWVATTGADGAPHVAPVWAVWVAGALWFGTDAASTKGRNLRRDGRVVVHLENADEAVIVHGVCGPVRFDDLADGLVGELDAAYTAKYLDVESGEPLTLSGGPAGAAVHRVTPVKVLAWREQDFPSSRTRWHLPG